VPISRSLASPRRRKVGVLQGDILDAIAAWPPSEQQRAYQAIAEVEEQVRCRGHAGWLPAAGAAAPAADCWC
jgi:hypothetical protein